MIINGSDLLQARPIKDMLEGKAYCHGVSHGLGEAGYDIRLKQEIIFEPVRINGRNGIEYAMCSRTDGAFSGKRFALGSSVEEFRMPGNLVGIVHDKSTWARQSLSVFNTVIEPGWCGFLTLELVYNGDDQLIIPAGAGIAQVLFHETIERRYYNGKYQMQADEPVPAKFE